MNGDGGFLVEEFLDAISAQLDRAQDALAAKAKVRPMTFALRNFAIDLQVFVGVDGIGNVRLRSAAPGETGSSTLKLDFTTITRPMIEENTVSLAMAQAPSLTEVGLRPQEQQQLERIGVRTVAQLQALHSSGAGLDGIARLTQGGVSVERLREALRLGRPEILRAGPAPAPRQEANEPVTPAMPPSVVEVPPGTTRLQLLGRNLLASGAVPSARLGGVPLETEAAESDRLELKLPTGTTGGALEVDLGTDEPVRLELQIRDRDGHGNDRWAPGELR
jgi:hypothetical protein